MENEALAKTGETNSGALEKRKVMLEMPSTEAFGKLDSMEPGYNLTAKYRKVEEWAKYEDIRINAFFLGMKEIPNDDGELINCGVFAAREGVFLAAQKLLVDAVRHLETQTPICITYKGKKSNKSSKGSTNMFDVQILQ